MTQNSDAEDRTRRNADVDWLAFDAETYFQQYYGEPHPDDDEVVRRTARFLLRIQPRDQLLDVVDVGTGPNLFPLLAALPRAARLTAFEYAQPNIDWLNNEFRTGGMRPQWRHFWDVVRSGAGEPVLPAEPMERLRSIVTVEKGSVFDLPSARWDAATMFFCAESITSRRDEFEEACRRFVRCVRPGGGIAAAFLASSSGYQVADHAFPVVRISEAEIAAVFEPLMRSFETTAIGDVGKEIRSGYFGTIFVSGFAR